MHAVLVNREGVSNPMDIGGSRCAEYEVVVQGQNSIDELVGLRLVYSTD